MDDNVLREEDQMRGWVLLIVLALPFLALPIKFTDAIARRFHRPDRTGRALPADPPPAVLPAAVAADVMIGWRHMPSASPRPIRPGSLTALPVGCGDQSPVINRRIGLMWLMASDAFPTDAIVVATVDGRVFSREQIEGLQESAQPVGS
jgi:hypothetical protein